MEQQESGCRAALSQKQFILPFLFLPFFLAGKICFLATQFSLKWNILSQILLFYFNIILYYIYLFLATYLNLM
jgi:hypothetical protein